MPPFGTEPDWATPGDTSAAPTPSAPQNSVVAPQAAGGDESSG